MITYGFSIQGKGHIEKRIICQDASRVERIKSGHYLGIVADGVGSAAHADIGSDIAVKSLFQYCDEHIDKKSSTDTMERILSEGYSYALEQIEQYVKEQRASIDDFDTTLSAAVYDGNTIVYGHAGDGGIIIKEANGSIKSITTRQKGADGISVRPLRAGENSWAFGTTGQAASVLLVTDGMLDGVLQPVLVNLPPSQAALAKGNFRKDNIYITAAEFFMNPYSVYRNKNIKNPDEYMNYFLTGDLSRDDQETFLKCISTAYMKLLGKEDAIEIINYIKKYFYIVWAVKNVTDDKSIVCMINEQAKVTPQNIEFYQEPNWKWRQESYNALLYGKHLPDIPSDDPLFLDQDRNEEALNHIKAIDLDETDDDEASRNKKLFPIVLLSICGGFFAIGIVIILILSA